MDDFEDRVLVVLGVASAWALALAAGVVVGQGIVVMVRWLYGG